MDTADILKSLEAELKAFEYHRITPLACDKWIASSALQKTVRRGQTKFALRAGFTLWQQDRASFWRRIHVMSCEDIGVASSDVVVKVLTAYSNTSWRARNDDLKVGLYLIGLMCGADKTRVADELLAIAGNGICLKRRREKLFFADNVALADVVVNDKELLPDRALALWLLAGTDIFPHDNMPTRRGSPQFAAELVRDMCPDIPLALASVNAMRKTQWPLALFTPLIYQAVTASLKGEQTSMVINEALDGVDLKGIPLTALDQYTRVGKAVIREMQSKLAELRPFTTRQIGTGIFYTEGDKLDKRLSSPLLDSIHQHAGFADFEGAYGDAPSFIALREILSENNALLQSLRKRHLKEYLSTQNSELLFEGME